MTRFARTTLVAFAVAACGGSATPAAVEDASHLPADQVIYDVRHNMTKDGVRTGELVGDSAYLYESSRRMDIQGVELRFFSDNGTESGLLTARTGEYQIRSGSFVARGDVVLVQEGPQGKRRLETEELHYDVQNDRLWSEEPFVLKEDGGTTRGTSFRSDAEFRNWSVTGARTEGGIRPNRTEGSLRRAPSDEAMRPDGPRSGGPEDPQEKAIGSGDPQEAVRPDSLQGGL